MRLAYALVKIYDGPWDQHIKKISL